MALYEKNTTYTFVGNVVNAIADEALYTGMANGSLCIMREDQKNEETALSGTPTVKVRVVEKKYDGTYTFSPWFTYNDILTKQKALYSANTPQEQISYIGYDGTTVTGLGTVTAGEVYQISVWLLHTQGAANNTPFIKSIPYQALVGDTESSLAYGLTSMAIKVLKRNLPTPIILAERIYAGAQSNGLAATVSVTNGSTAITCSADMTAVLINGTIIRLGTQGANSIAPVYIIASQDAGVGAARVYNLDIPWQGATNAAIADASTETAVAGAHWGIKLTGIKQVFSPIRSEYTKVRFKYTLSAFDSNVVSYTGQVALEGSGTFEQVNVLEKMGFFNEGRPFVEPYPPTITRGVSEVQVSAGTDNTYDIITVEVKSSDFASETTGSDVISKWRMNIAVLAGLTYDNLDTVLGA